MDKKPWYRRLRGAITGLLTLVFTAAVFASGILFELQSARNEVERVKAETDSDIQLLQEMNTQLLGVVEVMLPQLIAKIDRTAANATTAVHGSKTAAGMARSAVDKANKMREGMCPRMAPRKPSGEVPAWLDTP